MEEERLTALAMLSMEKEFVHQLVDFNERDVYKRQVSLYMWRLEIVYLYLPILSLRKRENYSMAKLNLYSITI